LSYATNFVEHGSLGNEPEVALGCHSKWSENMCESYAGICTGVFAFLGFRSVWRF
jgi:hypothetical protein